jgi:hypothetical protein
VEWLLQEYRAGRREPEPVSLLNVSTLPCNAQTVAVFFATVHGLRLTMPALGARPVPFGCEWVGSHLGMSKATVWRALRMLEAAGVLKRVGSLPGRDKLGVHLYLPEDGGS